MVCLSLPMLFVWTVIVDSNYLISLIQVLHGPTSSCPPWPSLWKNNTHLLQHPWVNFQWDHSDGWTRWWAWWGVYCTVGLSFTRDFWPDKVLVLLPTFQREKRAQDVPCIAEKHTWSWRKTDSTYWVRGRGLYNCSNGKSVIFTLVPAHWLIALSCLSVTERII